MQKRTADVVRDKQYAINRVGWRYLKENSVRITVIQRNFHDYN